MTFNTILNVVIISGAIALWFADRRSDPGVYFLMADKIASYVFVYLAGFVTYPLLVTGYVAYIWR